MNIKKFRILVRRIFFVNIYIADSAILHFSSVELNDFGALGISKIYTATQKHELQLTLNVKTKQRKNKIQNLLKTQKTMNTSNTMVSTQG